MADFLLSNSGLPSDEPNGIAGTPVPANYLINLSYRLLPPGSPNPHHWRISEYSTFAQDDIKVTRQLTVNLGLRWEYDGWPTDQRRVYELRRSGRRRCETVRSWAIRSRRAPSFLRSQPRRHSRGLYRPEKLQPPFYGNLTGQFGSTGIAVNSNKTLLNGSPLDNFSPRVGLAWQAMDKLVIRAGYGMFFDRVYGNLVGDNIVGNHAALRHRHRRESWSDPSESVLPRMPAVPGLYTPDFRNWSGDPGAAAGFDLSNITDIFGGNASGLLNPGDDPAMRTPKVQQYNVDVQYEFAHGWIADVGYVGIAWHPPLRLESRSQLGVSG